MRRFLWCAVLTVLAATPMTALAWGERGHDLVTQVGVRMLGETHGATSSLYQAFLRRSGMLGHLSNIPDIHWRNAGPAVGKQNGPTHYVHLAEMQLANVSVWEVSTSYTDWVTRLAQKGVEASKDGSAPWRVGELAGRMEEALRRAGDAGDDRKAYDAAVVEALTYAGLLSHFVGDLAQPYHVTSDYDGWQTGQGGIHAYFEGKLVDAQPPGLAGWVWQRATQERRGVAGGTFASFEKKLRAGGHWDSADAYFYIALLLAQDSEANKERVRSADEKFAVKKLGGTQRGDSSRAVRYEPHLVAKDFTDVVVERLAVGADVLAGIWTLAHQRAGKPDISRYHGYDYPLAPEFVVPSYLPRNP